MSEQLWAKAWVGNTERMVPIKPRPVDPRRLACKACGAKVGQECVEIGTKQPLYGGHQVRRREAEARREAGQL